MTPGLGHHVQACLLGLQQGLSFLALALPLMARIPGPAISAACKRTEILLMLSLPHQDLRTQDTMLLQRTRPVLSLYSCMHHEYCISELVLWQYLLCRAQGLSLSLSPRLRSLLLLRLLCRARSLSSSLYLSLSLCRLLSPSVSLSLSWSLSLLWSPSLSLSLCLSLLRAALPLSSSAQRDGQASALTRSPPLNKVMVG